MSAIAAITSGLGIVMTGGDLADIYKKTAKDIMEIFGSSLNEFSDKLKVPAGLLKIKQCTYLFIGKDTMNLHFVFVDVPGQDTIIYNDLSVHGNLNLQSIIYELRMKVGEALWAFSCPLNLNITDLEKHIQAIVEQYVQIISESQNKPDSKISDEAISLPEIAYGIEKFR